MKHPPSRATPSAVLRRGLATAFSRLSGAFTAKAPAAPPAASLETILLPHARTRWLLPAASGMTPAAIGSILAEALTGRSARREQELYSLMESTWPRLLKNTMEIKDAVLSLDWNLMEPPLEEQIPGAMQLATRAMNGMKGDPITDGHGWRATLSSLLDAWTRGISIAEIQWEYRGSSAIRHPQSAIPPSPAAWLPRLTRDLPPWHFGWAAGPWGGAHYADEANDGNLRLYPDAGNTQGIAFPPDKFLIAIRKAGKGHPSGTALLRCLAWWWCAANFSQEWLLNFAQIFGQPFRWATYDASQDGVKDDLSAMMEAMGSAAYGVGPEGTKIEWHESSKSGADNPQSHILTLADTACDLLVLGQTLTSTQGSSGSLALGEVHQSVRADVIDSAAAWLAEILNEQLIPSIVRLNYGDPPEDSSLPWFQPARKNQKDTKALAETIKILLDAGVPLLTSQVYDMLDLARPEPGEDTLGGTPAATPPADTPPDLRRFLAKLPLDAREYFLARMTD